MTRIVHLYSLLLIFNIACRAQSSESLNLEGFRVTAGFMAESFVHPGGIAGIERNLWTSVKQKYNDRKEKPKKRKKVVLKEFYWGGSVGGYNHPNNEFLLFLSGDLGYQRSSSKGSIWSVEVSLGGYRSFYNIPTYKLTEEQYEEVSFAGQWGFMPRAFLSWGWSGWLRNNKSWSFKLGPMMYLRTPYNHTTVASGAIVAELIIHDLF
jgi:hypothetical protein